MESFRCYENFDVIATPIMTNFQLNTTVVAIFPSVCLGRRSLCSNLVLTLKTVSSHLHMPVMSERPMLLLQYGPILED